MRGDVERLKAPVEQVATLRPRQHARAVHVELVTIVPAGVNDEVLRRSRERERLAEVKHPEFALRPSGCAIQRAVQLSLSKAGLMVCAAESDGKES